MLEQVVSLLVEGLSGIAEAVYEVNTVCRLTCTSPSLYQSVNGCEIC